MLNWFKINQMKVNEDKFQYILFCKNKTINDEYVSIGSNEIMSRSHVKLLGVYFDQKLSYDYHVNELCRKAGRKLSILGRLTKTLDVASKMLHFHTYILSQFEYCSLVWHFCSRDKMKKIEKIQKQALHYIVNYFNASYSELLGKANRLLMYTHRLRRILSFAEKCIEGKCPMHLNDLFAVTTKSTGRKFKMLVQPKYNSKYGCKCIRYQGPSLWNRVDNKFKLTAIFNEWSLECTCSFCDMCSLKTL